MNLWFHRALIVPHEVMNYPLSIQPTFSSVCPESILPAVLTTLTFYVDKEEYYGAYEEICGNADEESSFPFTPPILRWGLLLR